MCPLRGQLVLNGYAERRKVAGKLTGEQLKSKELSAVSYAK